MGKRREQWEKEGSNGKKKGAMGKRRELGGKEGS